MNKLAVENIHKCYGATQVLKGVSLAARPGEVISILGSSGSGKSTFLRCINLLEQPNQGAIWLDDQEIKLRPGKHGMLRAENQRALQQLRTKVAMVFQSFNLWSHLTALQNIIEAPVHVKKVPKPEAMAKARANLAKVGLSSEVEAKYPSQLSGGQQQRTAIARALVNQPQVVLADEPTGNLDSRTGEEILLQFQRLHREHGQTIVMVTHELDIALFTKRNIIMRDGVVVNDVAVQNRALAEVELRNLQQAQQAVKLSS